MQDDKHTLSQRSAVALLLTGGMLCVGSLLLSGCAETTLVVNSAKRIGQSQQSSQTVTMSAGTYKVGSSYQIQGRWYTPKEDLNYQEIGVASWYGPNFHGKSTANGETFDMYAMTAAHRTLPMPSVVRVTNLSNDRSVILRVNDRGPFARDRILDVSKAGAQALGFIKQGTARVKVEILPDESIALKNRILYGTQKSAQPQPVRVASTAQPARPAQNSYEAKPLPPIKQAPQPVAATPANAHFIQVGAFGDQQNAARLRDRLANLGTVEVQNVTTSSGALLHKVRIGPIMGQQKTEAILREVHTIGFTDAHVVVPNS